MSMISKHDCIEFLGHRIICGDVLDDSVIKYANMATIPVDTYYVDPPYNDPLLYSIIPENTGSGNKLLINTSAYNYMDGLIEAVSRGWSPSFEFIWDGAVSQKKQNMPLMRHKSIKCFGKKMWLPNRGIYIKNEELSYNHLKRNHAYLQTVYQENFATMKKWSEYQKPVNWLRAIFGGLGCASVLDYFAGSGSALFAAIECGMTYTGIEINPAKCDKIIDRLKTKYPHINISINKIVR